MRRSRKRPGTRPAKDDPAGGDGDAGFTGQRGTPHYGYKAHVNVDAEHTLIRKATLTAANVHDSREFETVVRGDEQLVVADKAYASAERRAWLARRGIHDGLLHRASRGQPLGEPCLRMNRFLSGVCIRIENIFGHWKRGLGYRRLRHVGWEPTGWNWSSNACVESEALGQRACGLKTPPANPPAKGAGAKRRPTAAQARADGTPLTG